MQIINRIDNYLNESLKTDLAKIASDFDIKDKAKFVNDMMFLKGKSKDELKAMRKKVSDKYEKAMDVISQGKIENLQKANQEADAAEAVLNALDTLMGESLNEELLNEALYPTYYRWYASLEYADIDIKSPKTGKTLTLKKIRLDWSVIPEREKDILRKIIDKAGEKALGVGWHDVEFSRDEMLVFMKWAQATMTAPKKVVPVVPKAKETPWGPPHSDGSYSQEASSLGHYDKCPKCGFDGVSKYLRAIYTKDEDHELTEWIGSCPKCKVKLQIWND